MPGTPSNDLNIRQSGLVVFDGTATFTGVTLTAGSGISITNGSGIAGNPVISTSASFIEQFTVDGGATLTPSGSPLNITFQGTVVANATNAKALFILKTAPSAAQFDIQLSAAIAATDVTKVGLAAFNSAQFSVDANGFVSTSGTGIPNTITGDSGGALSPTAGNFNIFGLSGSKTSGSGSTLTVKSPPFSQVGSSATSSLNTGEFVTAAVTRTLPASAGLADGDLIQFIATTAGALVIQAVSAQKIRLGNQITSAAGSLTSTAIGDSISIRFNATDGFWYTTQVVGNWTVS